MRTIGQNEIGTPTAAPAGLTTAEAERSRRENGANILPRRKRRSFLSRFLANLGDPVTRILLFALCAEAAFLCIFREGDVWETVGIGVSVFVAALISTLSECGSERAFERLREAGGQGKCRVRRDGRICELPVGDVVCGDVVLLSAGENVPADGLLTRGTVGLDMSAMTGESRETVKSPSRDPSLAPPAPSAVLRGCFVTSGEGEMTVRAVGGGTFLGGISAEVQTETRDSPLKVRLARLARQISRLGYCAAILVAAAYLFNAFVLDSGWVREIILMKLTNPQYLLSHLLGAFTLALTVIVVAVPEGLPMMIAVVLSSNVRRMVRAGVLVKKPVGIEAAGSMNILFTDKTGTLTEGKMTVTGFLGGRGERIRPAAFLRGAAGAYYCLSCRCNTSSAEGVNEAGERSAVGGNPTDRALLTSVLGAEAARAEVCGRIPFDSAKKYSAVRVRTETGGREETVSLWKGAPELLIPHITSGVPGSGFDRFLALRAVGEECARGARTVVIALCRSGALPERGIPDGLEFVCAAVLRDPPRRTAPGAVRSLRGAGIHVVMVTGDALATAEAIAGECGILGGGVDRAVDSAGLARMTDAELREALPRIGVVARALPSDKSRLVRAAQEAGWVTGMTGDGINDAPALRAADVGFAMGSGSEIAKDAGDIVILDNDARSIANAVLYGRTVFKSIRKFITLQLTMNLCAVGVSMIGPFIGIDEPVTVVQMLWINMIMDTLGGLAFSGEPALSSYMEEPPKRRGEPIMNRYMVGQIVWLGAFTVGLSLCFLKLPWFVSHFRMSEGGICHLTGFFAFFIFASAANCFNARTDRMRLFANLSRNPVFIAIMAAVAVVQIVFVYLGGSVLRTVPLTAAELGFSALLALAVIPADALRKLILRLFTRRSGF